ncbi:MAG: hypothetical protein M1434_12035 [Chloroflexi bacterium]|nr:hypothetical protein [Chloroflexota bacterium]MCL5275452.1 hypothetical protein [Chloroflexota bacterium]
MAITKTRTLARAYDPRKVARYERDSWVAYYRKRWLTLLRVFIGLLHYAFGLPFLQTLHVAYLATRALIAFAPKQNDVTQAETYMRRFFEFIKQIFNEDFDAAIVARLEVNWWVVHRQFAGRSDTTELVEALTQAYAAEYGIEPAAVREAAYYRAQAMLHSDCWVDDGCDITSPLLAQEEEELHRSYAALRTAIALNPPQMQNEQ